MNKICWIVSRKLSCFRNTKIAILLSIKRYIKIALFVKYLYQKLQPNKAVIFAFFNTTLELEIYLWIIWTHLPLLLGAIVWFHTIGNIHTPLCNICHAVYSNTSFMVFSLCIQMRIKISARNQIWFFKKLLLKLHD